MKFTIKNKLNNETIIEGDGVSADDFITKQRYFMYINLRCADFRGGDFQNVCIMDAVMNAADLRGADFRGSHISYTYLINSDLRNANFENGSLSGSVFRGADLRGANLNNVCFEGANLRGAKIDNNQKDTIIKCLGLIVE